MQHKRIVGGVETLVNEYPWMVALQYNSRFYCGASLINSQYLLTAAHCVQGYVGELQGLEYVENGENWQTRPRQALSY